MQALLLIIPHTTVPHWTQRNTGKTREKGGKSLGTLQSTLQPQMWLEGLPMRASQLLDLLQGHTCDPGVCRMGLQGHRSVLEPTDARSWDQLKASHNSRSKEKKSSSELLSEATRNTKTIPRGNPLLPSE